MINVWALNVPDVFIWSFWCTVSGDFISSTDGTLGPKAFTSIVSLLLLWDSHLDVYVDMWLNFDKLLAYLFLSQQTPYFPFILRSVNVLLNCWCLTANITSTLVEG